MYHVVTTKMRKLKQTPLPKAKWPAPNQVPLQDENLPDEIKLLVSEGNVESVVYNGSGYRMQANYKLTYKKEEKDSGYTSYELLVLKERLTNKAVKTKKLSFNPFFQTNYFQSFFSSRLKSSFTQIVIILFLIVVSLTKLVFSKLDCEESTFSLLSCTVGHNLPSPKLWTK